MGWDSRPTESGGLAGGGNVFATSRLTGEGAGTSGCRDRLRRGLGGEREHDAHRLLRLVRIPCASSLGLAPALGRGS
jgi:hypothetical protein